MTSTMLVSVGVRGLLLSATHHLIDWAVGDTGAKKVYIELGSIS